MSIAAAAGVSPSIIAVTLIALGTSLPELSVSIAAARRREGDIVVGNILGSNIANLLLVLGVGATIHPLEVGHQWVTTDFPMAALLAMLMMLFLISRTGLTRPKALLLLVIYTGFILFRVLN